jgi:hypothetical protein
LFRSVSISTGIDIVWSIYIFLYARAIFMYNWGMMKPAKKVFVSGSKSISALSIEFLEHLSHAVQERSEILVGDCYGVDAAVQKHLADINYPNVTVYCSGEKPRNFFLEKGDIHSCIELSKGRHRTRFPICQGY